MSVTILMPVFNAVPVVTRTLRYLVANGVDPAAIQVADDGSPDPTMPQVAEWAVGRGIRWRRSDTNLGYTHNLNRCLPDIDSEYVLIMNSDCFITSSSIAKLREVLQRFEMVGCVGPLSSNAGHQTVLLKREIRWQGLSDHEIRHYSDRIEQLLTDEFGLRPWLMPTANGFCCLWRTSVLRELGYFDAAEFPRGYGEEDDICLRLMETGRFAAIAPFVFAPHLKTQSFSTKERDALKTHAQNKLRMKFSNATIERLLNHYARNPQIGELRRLTVGG